MLARVFRSLIAFGVVMVAYQAYALLVSPLIEPKVKRAPSPLAEAGPGAGRNAVSRYQAVLAHYFPKGHWTLTGLPKVIESGPVMLVVDDYQRDDRGRVDLTKCAAVLFPTPRVTGEPPPDDAVILEAPGGARLQFDENFQPSRGKVGRITSGEFPGPVTIRSGMREPGPDDDLLISTRDVRMNESLVFTPHDVEIRHGRSVGRGRRLEIKLLEEEQATSGLKIAGVESIEIFEHVKLELRLGEINPLRGEVALNQPFGPRNIHLTAYSPDDGAAAWGDGPRLESVYERNRPQPTPPRQVVPRAIEMPAPANPTVDAPPLEITCAGSFRMDLTDFVATFHDRVLAWQLNLDGQSDQLTCRELRLYFGGGGGAAAPFDPRREPEVAKRQKKALSALEPRRMEAVGEPVKIDSPSRQVSARGRSLTFDFAEQRLTLDGGQARIVRGANVVEAPIIRYEHPPEGDPAAIGRMWVAGPGRLRAVPKTDRPEDVFEARWGKAPGVEFPVTLDRNAEGQPVLTVLGRPEFNASGLGRLTSERLIVQMRETEPDGPDGPAIELGGGGENQMALLTERIDADGRVEVESPKLSAATDHLTVWVQGQMTGASQAGGATDGWATGPSNANANENGFSQGRESAKDPGSRYRLTARQAQLEVALAGRRAEPTSLTCDGAVDFRELTPKQGEEPLRVRGERLRVKGLESDAVRLTIHGAPIDGEAAPATITARGVTLHATDAHLDQAANRLWADGPGDAHLRTKRDFLGQETTAATDLHLSWQGGWVFDGRRIVIRDNVFGEGPHDWVRTNELVATLVRPVTFGKSTDQLGGAVEVEQIDCRGGVTLDHRTVDAQGQRSQERAQLQTLSINQSTGTLAGTGPGWVRSVRLSSGGNPLGEMAGPTAAPTGPEPEQLRLLRVHFQNGVAGNFKNRSRQINFLGRVRAIYGPVLAWQQDLPVTPTGPLPPDTATLACEQLQVSEDPMARFNPSIQPVSSPTKLAPLELIAAGSVRLEGAADDGTVFNAEAARASFNQIKELFVLNGDSTAKATLWVQKPGEGQLRYPAGEISYWRKTGKVQTDNFGGINYQPTATRPAPPPR